MSKLWKSLLEFGSNPGRIQTKPTEEAASHQTKPTILDPADRFNYSVGPEIVPYDHEPIFCEDNEIYIKSDGASENLVELQQQLIVQLQQKISNMARDTQEKEETFAKLETEVADSSRHHEGQLDQLLWLDMMVSEKDAKI